MQKSFLVVDGLKGCKTLKTCEGEVLTVTTLFSNQNKEKADL